MVKYFVETSQSWHMSEVNATPPRYESLPVLVAYGGDFAIIPELGQRHSRLALAVVAAGILAFPIFLKVKHL